MHKLKGLISLFFIPTITDALSIAENESRKLNPNKITIEEQTTFISIELPLIIQAILNNFLN